MGSGVPPPIPATQSYTWSQYSVRWQKYSSFSLPQECLNYILSQLLPGIQLLINLHIGADCDPSFWDIDGAWHTLKLLEATKNKEGGLDNHKGLRDNQEHGLGQLMRFISYMRPVCVKTGREVAVLANVQKPTQRIKKNEETREYVPSKRIR